ncbi:MAG: NADP-dependent phosphogluconate dehydrogenase, partial [Patescibacteria group bacterium]
IWVMVPWKAVDSVVSEISPLLQKGDMIIDGGNSPYKDSIRRAEESTKLGLEYLDAGVSGGPSGARNGACIMVGGEPEVFMKVELIFKDLALPDGYLYAGKSGAGHFAKMVHNGIEYGMMQSLAEGFTLIRESKFKFDLEALSKLFNTGSVIESRLVGWLSSGYKKYGTELGAISGEVAASGEGKWTVNFAKESGIDVPAIESALAFRERSAGNPTYLGKVLSVLRNQFGGHSIK